MSSAAELRALAVSLPHVAAKPHFDRTSFYVDAPRGKTVCTLAPDEASINLLLTPDEQSLLTAAEPLIFTKLPNKWVDQGWTMLNLAACDAATLRSAVVTAYRRAAPPKVRALFDSDHA